MALIQPPPPPKPTLARPASFNFVVRTRTIPIRKPVQDKTIMVQRKHAIGDAIVASVVATKLKEQGYKVKFATKEGSCRDILRGHPDIDELISLETPGLHVNLDKTYELAKERISVHLMEYFMREAYRQLSLKRIPFVYDYTNLRTKLYVSPEEELHAHRMLDGIKIAIVPRSNTFPVRTVPDKIWEDVVNNLGMPCAWLGNHGDITGAQTFKCQSIREVAAIIKAVDLVVSVDTGPLNMAGALGKPIVAIEQAVDPALRLAKCCDFNTVGADIDCLNCSRYSCPKNKELPLCQNVDPQDIIDSIRHKWNSIHGDSVTAIIPVFNRSAHLLNKCISAILPQVEEVFIVPDGLNKIPVGLIKSDKIKLFPNPEKRLGFGKNVNRVVKHAKGRFVLMLNDDFYAAKGIVGSLKTACSDNTAVVGCLTRYPDGRIYHGGTVRCGYDFGHIDNMKTVPSITQRTQMEFVNLAIGLVRREAWFESGGFDEKYDCYCEDSDLCLTFNKLGWKVIYEPVEGGIHDEGKNTSVDKAKMLALSRAIFQEKWKDIFK